MIPDRKSHTYRCQVCGMECVNKHINGLAPTKLGNYGSNATPSPTTYSETVYEATTVSFDGDNAKLVDSQNAFAEKHFMGGETITVETTSGVNDGTYTLAERGVTRSDLSVTTDLTTESASAAGTVTIKRVIYQPNVTTGCPFCGSLNSKGA